jgi:predicted dienelactone hydrolase
MLKSMRRKHVSVILIAGVISAAWPIAPATAQDGSLREQLRERFLQRQQQLQSQRDQSAQQEQQSPQGTQQQQQTSSKAGQQQSTPDPQEQASHSLRTRIHKAIEKSTIGGVEVAIWRPTSSKPQTATASPGHDAAVAQSAPTQSASVKVPLIIFSHGYRGSPTQSVPLMQAMADAGYLVMAPKHRDALDGGHLSEKLSPGFGRPQDWNKDSCSYRFEDVRNVLDSLHKDSQWNSMIDWSRVALAGHSLGGYTVLGLAGAWPQWKTSGIKAVLALSPYSTPFVENGDLKHLGVPVMYQGGTADFAITPSVKRRGGAFDETSAPAYFVDFDKANHFSWTGLSRNADVNELINHYCLAFLNKYVNDDPSAKPEVKLPGIVELEVK